MATDIISSWKMPWATYRNTLYPSRFSEGTSIPRQLYLFTDASLAEDVNLEMVYRRSFHEIYEDEKDDENFGRLMDRMGVKDEDGTRGIKGEEWDAAGFYLAFAFEKRGGY